MSPSRRTFSSLLILLSLNSGLVSTQISGKLNILPEACPNFKGPAPLLGNSLLNAPGNTDLLSTAQRLLPGYQRPILNELATPVIAEPPALPLSPQVHINSLPSVPIPNIPTPCNTASVTLPSEVLSVEPVPSPPPYTLSPISQSSLEYLGGIERNCPPLGPVVPLGPLPQTDSLPEAIYSDNIALYPAPSQFYQSPISVQVPSIPAAPLAVATQVPGVVTQSIPTSIAAFSPGIINSITNAPSIAESFSMDIPYSILESMAGCGQQLPMSLQINMPPSPSVEQPIILVSSPTPTSTSTSTPTAQDYKMLSPPVVPPMVPPYPIIVKKRSRSRWGSWLPLLLIALCDGGCRNNCGGDCGCSGGSYIPIPYPIPMPINNPIIVGKGKASSDSDDD